MLPVANHPGVRPLEPGGNASRRCIVHLTASPFYGGPERQMLGLAQSLPSRFRTVFLAFAEGGRANPFLEQVQRAGLEAITLRYNAPKYKAAAGEVAGHLRALGADVLCCHGYKPDILGLWAARRARVPVVAVSRGWTGATVKVRLNEMLDRWCLRWMDRVVCVSEGQAEKVRRAGVRAERVRVIHNAIRLDRFGTPDPRSKAVLQQYFPAPRRWLVGAAGRLSPEKGFGVLIEAAETVVRSNPNVGFVLFGEGPLRAELAAAVAARGLNDSFVLAGFRTDLDALVPHFDLLVLPSFTEGLPNVALEACAAGVPVVATAVGGTPEVIEDQKCGSLVPPGDAAALAAAVSSLLGDEEARRAMGAYARQSVRERFTFEAQALQYGQLFDELVGARGR